MGPGGAGKWAIAPSRQRRLLRGEGIGAPQHLLQLPEFAGARAQVGIGRDALEQGVLLRRVELVVDMGVEDFVGDV